MKSLLNAGRAVQNNIVELLFQVIDHLHHLSWGNGCFVPGLGRGHQIQPRMTFVAYQGLLNPAVSLHHIHQIVYNAVLQSHNHIQIAQSDIRVNQTDFFSKLCQTCSNICGCGGLAHTALT